ncbi:hypothetical protein KP509_02G069100 [Ceratopteris richardii]|uniref:Uncharacterized protein n=1 Tax=Ceratopteris richardii TaxID=49495 RepID=A0A8T2VAE1_CERRI|nr:hypothetical protein KP509_02G069100 [Ceratopteris richardii]
MIPPPPPRIHDDSVPGTDDTSSTDTANIDDDSLPWTDDTSSTDTANIDDDSLPVTDDTSSTDTASIYDDSDCSSANPCVDFFFQIVPDTPADRTVSLLEQAWVHDSLTCLKLVCHLRGVRGTGKSNQQAFYTCASWLHRCHPQTLLANLHLVPKFGYYKDLREIVLREIEGPDEVQKRLEDNATRKRKIPMAKSGGSRRRRSYHDSEKKGYWARKGEAAREAKKAGVLQDREVRIAIALEKDKMAKETASQLRRQRRKDMAGRVENKLRESPRLAALYNAVAEIFAKQLQADMTALNSDSLSEISFAAKWCPSQGKSYGLRTSLYQKVAELIFCNGECKHLDDEMPAVAMTEKLRTEFLVPLRRALELPEIYMSANRWKELPYERVPSVAMTNYVDQFVKHDNDRYLQYLEKVASGKKKVAAGALLPHEVACAAVKDEGEPKGVLTEAQWKRMVRDLKESGSNLGSSMAVCDVSGSMVGTPMEVCIALGLLVAELSEEPFKNKICTFSSKPQIHLVQGETLAERYRFTEAMDWGMNTDFRKVFRLILDLAIASDLPKEKMVKRLFVVSDMEFDQASAKPWKTDYRKITKMFQESVYGEPPEIVFWNLRDSYSTPVLCHQKGVALVSGFSKNMLKDFSGWKY